MWETLLKELCADKIIIGRCSVDFSIMKQKMFVCLWWSIYTFFVTLCHAKSFYLFFFANLAQSNWEIFFVIRENKLNVCFNLFNCLCHFFFSIHFDRNFILNEFYHIIFHAFGGNIFLETISVLFYINIIIFIVSSHFSIQSKERNTFCFFMLILCRILNACVCMYVWACVVGFLNFFYNRIGCFHGTKWIFFINLSVVVDRKRKLFIFLCRSEVRRETEIVRLHTKMMIHRRRFKIK